jgi:hypothetical protein
MAEGQVKGGGGGEIDLSLINDTRAVSTKPDKPTKAEIEAEEGDIRNALLRQLLHQRGTYALGIFLLVVIWLIGIFLLLACEGFPQ